MEPEQIEVTQENPFAPTGEVVSPELTEEVAGTPATPEAEVPEVEVSPEEAEEQAALKEAGLESDTPAAHKWAEMRRDRREAKKVAEEAKLEAARWRGRAEALAERGQVKEEVAAPPAPELPEKPQESAFEDYSSYVEALTDWKASIRLAEFEAKQSAKEAEKANVERAKKAEAWVSQGKDKFPDFDAVVTKPPEDGGPAITWDMASVINSSPISHELAYHLGKNVSESRRIAALPPLEMARELGRIESELSRPASVKPRTQTNAPAPIKPISGDGATAAVTKKEEEMTTKEYIDYMDKKEFGSRKK